MPSDQIRVQTQDGGHATAPAEPQNLVQRVDALDVAVAHASRRMVQMMDEFDLDMDTGVQTRAALLRNLARLWVGDAARLGEHSVLHIWIPEVGAIALGHGSAAGIALICAVASALQSMLREGDLLGRLTQDELVAVMLNTQPDTALHRLHALRQQVAEQPLVHAGRTIGFRILGASSGLQARPTVAELLDHVAAGTRAAPHGPNEIAGVRLS